MDETMVLHTVDIEAYEAALDAAAKSLRDSDLATEAILRDLSEEEGVVGEAAERVLEEREVN